MQMRLYAVAAVAATAVLVSCPAAALGQGCDPSDLFEDLVNYGAGVGPLAMAMGDLNGDGVADLATANANGQDASVLLNNGDGTFAPHVRYGTGRGPRGMAMGDLNGDGLADLVTANSGDDTVSVLLGSGDGAFLPSVQYNVGQQAYSVAIADLDGDGDGDLVTGNNQDNDASVLLNNGDGTFGARVDYGVGDGPQGVAIADLDGDGAPDLAVADARDDTVSVLFNNGDGTFAPRVSYGVGNRPRSVAIGDLDGDGAADLAVANSDSNTVSVLLNLGDGTFGPRANYATPNRPSTVAMGDLNSDGVPDLATSNAQASAANRLSVLAGNGDGTFAPRANYRVGNQPASVAIGDLNGDGALDVATANFIGENATVLLNRCLPPAITTHPASLLLPGGGGVAEFGVVASGHSPRLYQWRRDGVDLVDGGGVSGSTTPTLTIDATIEDVAAYDVVVTNGAGTVVSEPAFLAVRPNPCPGDFNGDGVLNLFDFLAFQTSFVAGCP